MARWHPAQTEVLRAFHHETELVIVASGKKPTPCHVVDIDELPLTVYPAEYAVRWRQQGMCTQILVPYSVTERFTEPQNPGTIVVHTAEGRREVDVKAWSPPAAVASASGRQNDAIGYSKKWDFGEALQDAIGHLPQIPPGNPDELITFEVIGSGAMVGGVAGFNHLFVKVRRVTA